ncbi:dihydrodipicolinate synthase family protein [Streptosporangium sp. NPDC001559]|uniref:dihydrodipicolinate synthase family protein n=1 Tax=Streptosporangium sp. NPDC001559 TaxID=3366187 RepID=UPI0036E8A19E
MYRGLIAALVTPLTGDGEVPEHDIARLIASLRPYVTALLPALSTGEGWALSERQWLAMVGGTVRHAGGLPVLAGVMRPTTAGALERARTAARLGAKAVVATTPYGPGLSQEEMYRHYASLSGGAGLPVVVYHESQVSGNRLRLDTLLRVCALPGVAAVKDSAGDAEFTRRLVAARPGVPVLQGLESLALEPTGVEGHVLALANAEPELCAELCAAMAAASPVEDTAGWKARLGEAVERYGLARPDWYRMLKTELYRRSVLTTDQVAETKEASP